jgi:DNA (cytosine-5)-methyltransferase 1
LIEHKLTVADFFCGAGGFSEGFKEAGFNVVFGLDNWEPAIKTFQFNHPEAKCATISILDISEEEVSRVIPDTDVIIGSPPCTYFSKSNKGGNGDKKEGMELVTKFLQIVAVKKPKYWILENVVGLQSYIKNEYTYTELDLKGGNKIALKIPNMIIFNAADFGVPQNRHRFLCGNFLIPEFTNSDKHVTLGKIIAALPNPNTNNYKKRMIKDPNYNFTMVGRYLSDHFYDTTLTKIQWTESKRLKIDHSYYGKMAFPENLSKPSRTVMATLSRVSREAMVLALNRNKPSNKYRLPTIREIACIQSYPVSYQFIAAREETKYRLVGNSVPPLMAYSFANAISKKLGREEKRRFIKPNIESDVAFNLNGMKRKRIVTSERLITAKFRVHVPMLKIRNFRVDLDNLLSDFESEKFVWTASIHHGTGKENAEKSIPDMKIVKDLIKKSEYGTKFAKFNNELEDKLQGRIPNSLSFQKIYCRKQKMNGFLGPSETLFEIRRLIDREFPISEFSSVNILNNGKIEIKQEKIPLLIVAALYACKYVEYKTNSETNQT